jgi:hypothetical protein
VSTCPGPAACGDSPQSSAALEEDRKIRYLQRLVDFALATIAQTELSFDETERLVEAVRKQAVRLFPDKGDTFEMIYTPRFRRLISERYGLH